MGASLSNIDQGDYPAPDSALQENANYTLIPEFIGWALTLFLGGVVCAWYPIYAQTARRRKDKWRLQITALVVSILAVAASISGLVAIVVHGADQNRSNDEISLVVPADSITSAIASIIASIVQIFFAGRCFSALPRGWRWLFAGVIFLLALSGLTGGIGFSVVTFVNGGNTDVTRGASPDAAGQLFILAQMWLWSDAAADVLISTLLCTRLLLMRNRGEAHGISAQDARNVSPVYSWVGQLCRMTLGTALVTSITAVAAATTFITTYTTTNLALVFTNCLPGLYTLSCLWVLSSRHRFLQELDGAGGKTHQIVWDVHAPTFTVGLTSIDQPVSGTKTAMATTRRSTIFVDPAQSFHATKSADAIKSVDATKSFTGDV